MILRRAFTSFLVGLVLASLGASVAACSRRSAPPPGAIARRVVSLTPSTTEAMVTIGARDALVGRSRFCDTPPDIASLPQVGGYTDPNLEAILALRPDLVVGARGPAGPSIADRLAAHGSATYFPPTESIDQIVEMLEGLGARTGHVDGARRTADEVRRRVSAVERAVAGAPRPRVLLVFGLEPVVVAGPRSFPSEMVARAGGELVVREGGPYPVVGLEHVLALDPDLVLNAAIAESHGAERIARTTPGWKELRAVKEGRVVALTDESVLRPGPRVGEGLAVLARAMHPNRVIP